MGEGESQVLPYKRGTEKVLAMLKGGGPTKRFGLVLKQELEVLAMLKVRGLTKLPPFKRGGTKCLTPS